MARGIDSCDGIRLDGQVSLGCAASNSSSGCMLESGLEATTEKSAPSREPEARLRGSRGPSGTGIVMP